MDDVQGALIAHLSSWLDVPAYSYPPRDKPESFVTVERTGGSSTPWADRPNFAVQWWAKTDHLAAQLCEQGISALFAFVELEGVGRCDVGSSYSYPDPDSELYRWQTTCEVVAHR